MERKNVWIFIVFSLVLGVVVGGGVTHLYYRSLDTQISDINARLDMALPKIESDLSELETIRGDMEKESSIVQSMEQQIREISQRLNEIESKNRDGIRSLDQRVDELDERLAFVGSEIQNENTIVDVYNSVAPAVVFITSTVLTFDFQLQEEVPSGGVGSGVVVSPEGYILTNNHVVEGADVITVSFKPGEEIEAELVGTDPPTDLAVLKIYPIPNIPLAILGDSDKVKVGMTAIAIGNPFSLERTVTVGVVSSVNRTINAETGDIIFGMIQTDASVNPGNSGGPLVNSRGEVIGINSVIISPVRGSVGIGFAIPINTAKKVMAQLIETGRVSRPYIGINGGSVGDFPSELNLPEKGVLIIDVVIDSPADKAGLRGSDTEFQVGSLIYPVGGDVITSIDGQDITTINDLLEFLSKKDVGDTVSIGYIREGENRTTELILEERPER